MGRNGALSTKQRRAVVALVQSPTVESAADAVGIHRNTLTRWMGDPAFIAELDAATDRLVDEHVIHLAGELRQNLEILIQIRDDDTMPAGARLRAADVIERHLMTWTSIHRIERRVAALELATWEKISTDD